jgi:hypothetical protein
MSGPADKSLGRAGQIVAPLFPFVGRGSRLLSPRLKRRTNTYTGRTLMHHAKCIIVYSTCLRETCPRGGGTMSVCRPHGVAARRAGCAAHTQQPVRSAVDEVEERGRAAEDRRAVRGRRVEGGRVRGRGRVLGRVRVHEAHVQPERHADAGGRSRVSARRGRRGRGAHQRRTSTSTRRPICQRLRPTPSMQLRGLGAIGCTHDGASFGCGAQTRQRRLY